MCKCNILRKADDFIQMLLVYPKYPDMQVTKKKISMSVLNLALKSHGDLHWEVHFWAVPSTGVLLPSAVEYSGIPVVLYFKVDVK